MRDALAIVRTAEAAHIDSEIQNAVLHCWRCWRARQSCGGASQNQIRMRDGKLVVQTDSGEFPLADAVREFMAGDGKVFLPPRPAENVDHFLRQMRRIKS
jgi:hypothetical protein